MIEINAEGLINLDEELKKAVNWLEESQQIIEHDCFYLIESSESFSYINELKVINQGFGLRNRALNEIYVQGLQKDVIELHNSFTGLDQKLSKTMNTSNSKEIY